MNIDVGALCDAIYAKNAEIAEANETLKRLELEWRDIEAKLRDWMQANNTDIARSKTATVAWPKPVIKAQISDYDKFIAYCRRNKSALSLFERRIASTAYRDLLAERGGKPVPGLTSFPYSPRLSVTKSTR